MKTTTIKTTITATTEDALKHIACCFAHRWSRRQIGRVRKGHWVMRLTYILETGDADQALSEVHDCINPEGLERYATKFTAPAIA